MHLIFPQVPIGLLWSLDYVQRKERILGQRWKKSWSLNIPKNDQETAKNAQKKFQNRPKRYYSKDLKSFKNSAQNHSKNLPDLAKIVLNPLPNQSKMNPEGLLEPMLGQH